MKLIDIWKREVTLKRVIRDPYKMTFDPKYNEMQEHYHRSAREMPLSFFLRHNQDIRALAFAVSFAIVILGVAVGLELLVNMWYGL